MSQTEHSPEVAALMQRHATACDLKMAVNPERIADRLQAFLGNITKHALKIRFLHRAEELGAVGNAARAAWAAWDAWDARAARAARAAWDAWDARAARAAWDARAARAAWDARAARAAWDARAAWAYSWDLSWCSITAIGALARAEGDLHRTWLPLLEAFEAGAWMIWFTADELVVAERPQAVRVDDRRRLHCEDGPAFAWLDTIRDAYWHGVAVPEHVVVAPEKITVKEIEAQQNTEVRRVMITRYGQARYLVDSGAKQIHEDDYGVLYRKELPGDEPIVMVKVVNSTAEPDGSFKDYFLRVPPTVKTAREAVAWTFEKDETSYAPALQT